jgi:hypothetical protein
MSSLPAKQISPGPPTRGWALRIWFGCDAFAWLRLLARNRFAIDRPFRAMALVVTLLSPLHALLRWAEQLVYGRRVARAALCEAPLFVLGHWRTGTTLLHELLALDERHTYPTTYECLAPHHFLLTEGLLTCWLPFLMPPRRPMDNMAAGWDRPQEDEFALALLGQPSPYRTIAFPNRPPQDSEYLDLEAISPRARARWKRTFYRFLKRVHYRRPGRMVLKSPPHTCRIRTLLELFPDARFVHIVRDPFVVFPSTVTLWKTLYRTQGLQRPTFAGVEEYVFATFTRLYERLEEGRKLVAPSRFHELRYEDLVRDPVGQMEAVYEALGLGEFERVRPQVEAYRARTAGYRTNYYPLSPELEAEIARRWGEVIRRYNYSAIRQPHAAIRRPCENTQGSGE